ncbi:hypothetical protein SLS62_006063 [Diatrype stigma]|uniref:N-acetyltransferase domain-containing protein n=1 Tax=Diatrype stigma TaxID=117547 RepID=A0AAN9US66_9PEZI
MPSSVITPEVQILEAKLCDAPAMSSLGTRVFTESFGPSLPPDDLAAFLAVEYSAGAFEAEMRRSHVSTWIARGGGADADADGRAAPLFGYVYLVRGITNGSLGRANNKTANNSDPAPAAESELVAQLHRLYVDTAVHGRGIGTQLAAVAEARARSEGFKKLWLTVWEKNARAQRLYERLGFAKVGMADFDIGTCVLRDWIMAKDLTGDTRSILLHYGLPERIADVPETWAVWHVGNARTASLGILMFGLGKVVNCNSPSGNHSIYLELIVVHAAPQSATVSTIMSPAIEPYTIAVPDSAIERLKAKLALTTFPGETELSNDWKYGAPLDDVKRLVKHWSEEYDWRRVEAELNQLPQFTTAISVDGHEDALRIHFVHQKSDKPNSIPLLFCHGWPGSFVEAKKILPLLTSGGKEGEPTFHVVVPSLPNYGFSQRTSKPGFAPAQYAEVCHKLMLRLGYDKYVTQGGDWGSLITRTMASLYPAHVQATHVNLVIPPPPSFLSAPFLWLRHALGWYTEEEQAGFARTQWFRAEGSGYFQLQSTKPHTPGVALADSPAALLAWVYEKLHDWTDGYPWTDDEVLTWVSVYAFSDAGPDASLRIYYEALHDAGSQALLSGGGGRVPLGLSHFPRDIAVLPSAWGRMLGLVKFERRHTEGGHFAAYEKPELLVGDLREMFGKGGIAVSLDK